MKRMLGTVAVLALFVGGCGSDPAERDDPTSEQTSSTPSATADAPALPASLEENYHAQMEAVLAARVPAFSFTFGVPTAAQMDALKAGGACVMGTATTVDEAVELERRGADVVVAQGAELLNQIR